MAQNTSRAPQPLPLRIQVLVAAAVAVAAAVFAVSLRTSWEVEWETVLTAVLLAALIGAAHIFPLHIGPKVQTTADTAPAFAAALLLPVPWAILASAAGIGFGEVWRRTAPVQCAYNTAVAALRAAAAAVVFHALAPSAPDELLSPRGALPVVAAACSMYAVNTGLLDLVIAVQRRVSPFADWWRRHRDRIPHEAALYMAGIPIALVGGAWPPALLLLAVPSVAIYRALRDSVALRQRGQDALADVADVLDERLPFTAGHSRRVAELARILALRAGMPLAEADAVYQAARVHNLGIAAVRTSILQKPGPLTDAEREEVEAHPAIGTRLLVRFPEFSADPALILCHHERWDGSGYPRRLRGEQIPRGARVLALIDALVAMRSRRPYRPLLPAAAVRAELLEGRGTQFDPALVDLLLGMLDRSPEFSFDGVLLFGDADRDERAVPARPGALRTDGPLLRPES